MNTTKEQIEFSHKYAQIVNVINKAQTIKDLDSITNELLPLSELKQLLLSKLSKLNENVIQHSNRSDTAHDRPRLPSTHDRTPSLHSLYYNCIPFDEIFSDDILCSIIQYVASPNDDDMEFNYNKLPLLNRHFCALMRHKTSLYQQYKICVSLEPDLWKKRKSILISISHQTKCIYMMDPVGQTSGAITPPYITSSKPASKYNINFEILNLEDMNNKCPFIWYCCKTWHIISTSINANRLYSHNLYTYYNNKRVERVNRVYYSNDFSGYISPTDSLDLTPTYRSNRRTSFFSENDTANKKQTKNITENNSIMKQLLDKAAVHIRSVQIDDSLVDSKRRALKNFFWLNRLFHLRSMSVDALNFYSIRNLRYLDLIQTIHTQTFEILRELKQLLVIKLDLAGDEPQQTQQAAAHSIFGGNAETPGNDDENEEEKQWLVTFPSNIEYIQIKNFSNASNYVLNFNECKNIIAILFKDSKVYQWDLTRDCTYNGYRQIENCVIWPSLSNPIECVLFDDQMETRCIDNWHRYFQQHRHSQTAPIRYIRYSMLPTNTIFTHHCNGITAIAAAPPPPPHSYYYKSTETQSDVNSEDLNIPTNIATVDDNLSVRSPLTSVMTQMSTARDQQRREHYYVNDEEEEEDIFVPITPPSTNQFGTKSKKLILPNMNSTEREFSWTESSAANATDSGTTVTREYALERERSPSLDEEEEMKMSMLREHVTKGGCMLSVDTEPACLENIRLTKISDILSKHHKSQNDRECNVDDWCMVLDSADNQGLLWKLLLMSKYAESREDAFIADRISMYKHWFDMNIASWIYNLGHWRHAHFAKFMQTTFDDDDLKPFENAVIESPPALPVYVPPAVMSSHLSNHSHNNLNNQSQVQLVNTTSSHNDDRNGNGNGTQKSRPRGISSVTVSSPNVARQLCRSATVNTSPSVSSSQSVVDSLELYLPSSAQQ